MKKPVILLLTMLFFYSARTQDLGVDNLLKIFIDCERGCDHRFFRQEINYVNFMSDRQAAEVFIQVTDQRTGTGGRAYRMKVEGMMDYQGQIDTIFFYTDPDATDNVIRTQMLESIKLAILPYLLKTPLGRQISYEVKNLPGEEAALNSMVKDPWNYWVFRFRINTFFNGQESSNSLGIFNNINVNRTTEESKFFLSTSYDLNRSQFDISDEETVTSKRESANVRTLYVKSLTDHWSLGFRTYISTSTFRNINLSVGVDPAIEYNIFPYEESSQRQFTFRYTIGPNYINYDEVTIFDKLSELLWEHQIDVDYTQIKDWGTVGIELEYEAFLDDLGQYSLGINPEIEWNIAKGLNLNIYARIGYISNLRNIQKSEIDPNDILLQVRQLDTSFEYFGSIGMTYRFGSSINNIVNTRF